MEKKPAPEKSVSFSRNVVSSQKDDNGGHNRAVSEPAIVGAKSYDQKSSPESEEKDKVDESSTSDSNLSLPEILEEVDRFVDQLSSNPNESEAPSVVPDSIEALCSRVESMVADYEIRRYLGKFGQKQEEDDSFFECLNRISNLKNNLCQFSTLSNSTTLLSSLNRTTIVLHRGMSLLDQEFRALLENPRRINPVPEPKTPKTPRQSSFNSNSEPDHTLLPESESNEHEGFPHFSPETISILQKIATAMISSGYEIECLVAYSLFRRKSFKEEITILGFQNSSIEEVQKMQWDALEGEITTWNNVFKHCYSVLLSAERNLSDSIFSRYPSISQNLFSCLAYAVIMLFLNFGEAVVLSKRSAEKLFRFLDVYETLRDLIPAVDDSYTSDCAQDLIGEISVAKCMLGEAAANIFCELEHSIKRDQGRVPVPSGQVHPLTRYTMNYLKYACEYKDTLEQVFSENQKREEGINEESGSHPDNNKSTTGIHNVENSRDDETRPKSAFALQLMTVMELLDANLDMKSKLYRDPSLRYIFLMNNGRYILQKIKGSTEIHELVGIHWCRKRSTDLRQYHTNYKRETWSRLLQCMSPDGLLVNGKVIKNVLKERFKNLNAMFEEIHRTQSTWVVSDEQLQSELRVSISGVVIPAYRSFLGRFRQHLDTGRQTEKYIKYQPEEIETLIEELFDGNPTSMARRR